MKNEIAQEILTKLGTTAEHFHEIALKQANIELLVYVFGFFISLAITIFLAVLFMKLHENDENDSESKNEYLFLFCVLGLIPILSIFYNIYNILILLYNPEYWVIQHIISGGK